MKHWKLLLLAVLALQATGCGSFIAHSIARAPNRYPAWFSSEAPVTLAFSPKLLTNFVTHFVDVGPPSARLCYRIINPGDYDFKVSSTNWLASGKKEYQFNFHATVPGRTNAWTASPRGTVLLLHGYGVAQFSMLPWAFPLAQDGWRCVLVDLRGHGESTGKRVYFTVEETNDMNQLLVQLARDKEVKQPVALMGESYGAVLALRMKSVDPRLGPVVAIAPFATLSNAVLNIRDQYCDWVPAPMVRAGIRKLPSLLKIPASEFDTTTVLRRKPVKALFVAGEDDKIAPPSEVKEDQVLAAPGSPFIIVPDATHEALTYYFKDLLPVVVPWLDNSNQESSSSSSSSNTRRRPF
ncbi:MAG TPA: alpha/beta fold hydrolase [Verrucomicrobiae bacterium]|jgi:pimeloyl-ACP methyl ester carboxylesterase|nr:alpha/beta fold hydrolase [Verrucomicrobiae bacterium]